MNCTRLVCSLIIRQFPREAPRSVIGYNYTYASAAIFAIMFVHEKAAPLILCATSGSIGVDTLILVDGGGGGE